MRIGLMGVLLTLVSFGGVAQDTPLKSDGRMWGTWGSSSSQGMFIKAAYVQGAIEGLRAGAARGYVGGRVDEKQQTDAATSEVKTITAGMDKVLAIYTPHASVLDVVHQMDKFYSNYKNTPVCMIVAIQESIQSLNGTASSEQDLEMMRKQGCS
jgi:hypothetical protein